MSPEDAAARAWELMLQEENPMPPAIARDWVMEQLGCERDKVLEILVNQAHDRLKSSRPDEHDANVVLDKIRKKQWEEAERPVLKYTQ